MGLEPTTTGSGNHVLQTGSRSLFLLISRQRPSNEELVRTLVIFQGWSLNRQLKGQDAGGSRTRLKLLCRQPPGRLAPASFTSQIEYAPARSRTWSSTFAESRASATLRGLFHRAPHRGIGPRLAASKAAVLPAHSQGMSRSIPTWNRTGHCREERWSWTFGESDAIRYTIGTDAKADHWVRTSIIRPFQFRRGKTGGFLSRATSAIKHRCKESNPVERFWRPPALPGAHR